MLTEYDKQLIEEGKGHGWTIHDLTMIIRARNNPILYLKLRRKSKIILRRKDYEGVTNYCFRAQTNRGYR